MSLRPYRAKRGGRFLAAEPDRGKRRHNWRGLAMLARSAAADPDTPCVKLVELSGLATDVWEWPAPLPEGAVCRVLAATAYAFGRQTDAAARAALAPHLIGAAELVLDLLARTEPGAAGEAATPVLKLRPRRDVDDLDEGEG